MDTMTTTKIVGGVCGSLLIFLLVKWGAETIYTSSDHGETEAAYVIEVEGDDTEMASSEVEEAAGPTFDELYAAADLAAGEKVFKKCKSCHKLEDGANATGPFLYAILDRDIGGVDGYGYSDALSSIEGNWTPAQLDAFLKRPKDFAPGTKMSFAGLKREDDRANVIAYLAGIGG